MTIDIHKIITGNPISKNLMIPWGSNSNPNGKLFNKYTGPGNPVRKQVDFNSLYRSNHIKKTILPLQKMIGVQCFMT